MIRRAVLGGVLGLAVLTCPGVASAQVIRGGVVDSATGSPLIGAVVALLSSSGVTLARSISNERGQYRLPRLEGANRIRVVRLGFRPRIIALPEGPPAMEVNVTMTPIPPLLEPVQVTVDPRCSRTDQSAAALSLLEQARAGLLATIVAREANPATMVRLVYVRRMDGTSDRILSQSVSVDSSSGITRAYRAVRTGAEFVEFGFSADSGATRVLYGPDADVLLDDGFAAGYCFHLSDSARDRPNQVGLAFRPADRRRDRVDIEGSLWVDTVARELRDVEFRYVGLARELDITKPGGRVAFRTMPNGMVLIDRWGLRLPGAQDDTVLRGRSEVVRRTYSVTESGGEAATATWIDGQQWRASLGTFRGRAVDRDGKPVPGITIGLHETNYRTLTNSAGAFEISNVLPGPFTVDVGDSVLAPLGIAIETAVSFTGRRDSVVERTVLVPTAAEYVWSRCAASGRKAVDSGEGISPRIIGRIVDRSGVPVPGMAIKLSLETFDHDWIVLTDGVTGSDGVFQYCRQLPRRGLLELQVRQNDELVNVARFQLARPGAVTVVRVELPPR